MRVFTLLIFLGAILFSSSSYAGWVSGGGRPIGDANNPWFVQNTSTVSYCIMIDRENFGVSESTVRTKLSESLNYWRTQFAVGNRQTSELKIATQRFIETECTGSIEDNFNVDLVFQFGFLSEKQIDYFKNPTKIIGSSVRTSYDPLLMRGRGFVYIAPSRGSLAMDIEGIVSDPWELNNGGLLTNILIHELGHVFGIPHLSHSAAIIMKEGFPEEVLAEESAEFYSKVVFGFFEETPITDEVMENVVCVGSSMSLVIPLGTTPILKERVTITSQNPFQKISRYFGEYSGSPSGCIYFKNVGITQQDVYIGEYPESSRRMLGSVILNPASRLNAKYRWRIKVFLPPGQRVFESGDLGLSYKIGPGIPEYNYGAIYRSVDGSIARHLGITRELNFSLLTLSGQYNGRFYVDVIDELLNY